MVLIKVYGLDQYIVGNYSKEHTKKIADLLECKEDEINFMSPSNMIFHKGVEQTSWHATIEIVLEEKYHALQLNLTKYLIETFKLFSINLHIVFNYYNPHHYFEHINKEYPLYIEDKNLVKVDEEEVAEEDITDEDKVYTGNVFKTFKK